MQVTVAYLKWGNEGQKGTMCNEAEEGSGSEGECNLRRNSHTGMRTHPSQTPLTAALVIVGYLLVQYAPQAGMFQEFRRARDFD